MMRAQDGLVTYIVVKVINYDRNKQIENLTIKEINKLIAACT